MKPNELKDLVTKIVMNQTDQALLTDSLEKIVQAYEEQFIVNETLASEKENFETKIKELQDVNMRFFTQLQATGQPSQVVEDKKELTTEELAKLFI